MTSLSPWIRLFRPGNALIAAAAVWLGWVSLRLRPEAWLAAWGSLSILLLVAAGNADNDVRDIETDRVNRPHRPLPSGHIRVGAARATAAALYIGAVLLAWIGSPFHGALALAMAVLLWLYNRFLKGKPLSGNLAVSLLCGLAVYFVELPLLVDFPLEAHDSLPAALFAFLATFAREVVKDAEDIAGDRAAGHRTYAVAAGAGAARKLAFAVVALILAFLPFPALFFGYGRAYSLAAIALAGPLVFLLLRELARPDANFTRAQKLLKGLMLAGMVALLAGVLTR
ncbi:MAG: Digeranylgeranylglyceryl phosphate synthase [Fibrobacteria bacterium]|jgi:geranylgeranylglycerol-phosphate geranylgeranyltransferase|nr:Digeranylgeranylglyceryl phosphate synthase [Fibrobacteria bacterium]